ncbi:hypothetical protein RhiirA4_480127 [Rhizophagus irregularis]|uniref:Uncharacterized protein n=1 Tax=Rhizophagus irregularis TaxID=588596 RepID=A0A2I1HHG1_9GLOM|nr:hypothetical protein RhiirA4_480127 [Rhizophagus irregularis]
MSVFRKREEGADCGDSSDNREKGMARDMFFYDILRYWKEEDIVANLSKIGKVFRIQVKQQYKYKFARTYSYDAAAGLKARQERDKWQLIRDLTEDEMKEVTNSLKNYNKNTLSLLPRSLNIKKIGKL